MGKVRAVVLLSGGLDSTLAAKLMLEMDIELFAVNFRTVFCTCTPKGRSCLAAKTSVDQLGIPLKTLSVSREYLEIVKHPKHGYGRNVNPCIDCRIFMFRRVRDFMIEDGASFIITGEVLNQRPMSQRRSTMGVIERESGLEGLVLRPLCARHLKPTIPEMEGWVDRDKLLAMCGRSRKPQISLANEYGLRDYPCPAGGCLLTDSGFARRMRDLMKYTPDFGMNDVRMLKLGRHFRLTPESKLIIGRNETENKQLLNLVRPGDVMLDAQSLPGPLAILRSLKYNGDVQTSASIVAAYSRQKDAASVRLCVTGMQGTSGENYIETVLAVKETYEYLRI